MCLTALNTYVIIAPTKRAQHCEPRTGDEQMASSPNQEERTCKHCPAPAFLKRNRWRCARHHRYVQMCADAKYAGKVVPTYEQLDAMPGSNLICPTCNITMSWFSKEGGRAKVAALQHYRDGSLAIVCLACNTRHGAMPGDEYRTLPSQHKRCPKCATVKPCAEFYIKRWGDRPPKIMSECKECCKKKSQRKRSQARKEAA